MSANLSIAQVLAHCGGSPAGAAEYLARAIAEDPAAPEPYQAVADLHADHPAVVMAGPLTAVQAYWCFLQGDMDEAAMLMGTITGYVPRIAWPTAPWFASPQFLDAVSPEAIGEGARRLLDYGHNPASEPWFHAVRTIAGRIPPAAPEALTNMAIMLRECGRPADALALCDRADAIAPVMITAVARAGAHRKLGDFPAAVAAFHEALAREPGTWSLYLDLADLHAVMGDFEAAVSYARQGRQYDPAEVTLEAAESAYQARLGSVEAARTLLALMPRLATSSYGGELAAVAAEGPGLPADLKTALRSHL
ncbi:hypothetical protein GCM10010435_13990 [Winogradskya consettensis]|uniref:Tetratricopeptide repeat protein n=1 Tax=Winogradskya consettensis TaxID=113560 RepID=A0A919VMJ9_9ACTN|nr:tetratricopeptide repeat protein [Actinoplanes consettensis]GIM69001.1 hypothetical protein Aco04nite_13260 [Actinoplanes consettensis]